MALKRINKVCSEERRAGGATFRQKIVNSITRP
jgi:hypothetical protein